MPVRRARFDVVCFGEILWDLFEVGPVPAGDAIASAFRPELGGAPANVAVGLARLGVRSAMVGGVGRDRFGEALAARLRADSVDDRFLVHLPARTGLTFVTRDPRGEPRFTFYRHESADVSLRSEQVTAPMGRARWVLVGTSTLMTTSLARATRRFLSVAEQAGAHVVVDLNVRPHLWPSRKAMQSAIGELAGRAHLVKASASDLRAVGDSFGGVAWLRRHAPRASWVITRGEGEATAVGEHGEVHAPALPSRCVDATGAGDAFLAGSLAALLAARALPGSSAWRDPAVWQGALQVGHILGKKAVSRVGAVAGLRGLSQASAAIERVRRYAARSGSRA